MLRLVSLFLCGTRLCEAGSAFLPLADEDNSTTSTTSVLTTIARTTTPAGPHADVADVPQAIVIRGATGDAKVVNGRYKAVDAVNGHPSWVKVKDIHVRLAFSSNISGGIWHVESDKLEGHLLKGECDGQCLPSDVKSWRSKKDQAWISETVTVGSLDESFSSDWLAPTLTVLAALIAVAAASAGAGSVQNGSELCSMSGTWFSDSECYSVTATNPSFLPSFLPSLLGVAFPVPIPVGDLQVSWSSRHAPLGGESAHDVRMKFHKAFHEQSSQIWESDEGATILRLSADSAEFTLPGLEKCLLWRMPANDRTRMLPITWFLLACVWFRPPVTSPNLWLAGLFVAFGLLQLAVSYASVRLGVQCSLRGAHHAVREVAAFMPFLFLLAFDFCSRTLTGSIMQVALLSLHMLSLLGPRLLSARPGWVTVAGLVGWLVAALACIFFYVGLLLQSDTAWAFDRSKATVALACLGSWLAVPMQIGSHRLARSTDAKFLTQREGGTEESLSWGMEAGMSGVGGGKKVGTVLSSASTASLLSTASTSDWHTLPSVHRMPSHLSDVSAASCLSATLPAVPLSRSPSLRTTGMPLRQESATSVKSTSKASSGSRRSYAPSIVSGSPSSEAGACMSRPGEALSASLRSSQSTDEASTPSRQGSAASMKSTTSNTNSRSSRSKTPNVGIASLASEAGALLSPGKAVPSASFSAAARGKDDLLLAMLQVGESQEPCSQLVQSHASLGAVDQEPIRRSTSSRRSYSRTRSLRVGPPQDSLQSEASLRSPRRRQDASAASSEALLAMPTKQKRKHAKVRNGQSVSLGVVGVADESMLLKQQSERSVSLTPLDGSTAGGLERIRSAGPSRSMSGCSVSSSVRSRSARRHSEPPKIRVAPGDRLMFVNRTGHEYDARCQEYEIVTVVARLGGSPPVKVQWQNGFIERVRMEDLSEMPSLQSAGGSQEMEAIPDMPGDNDQRPPRAQKSRSPSRRRRAIPRMPDMPTLEGGFMDF